MPNTATGTFWRPVSLAALAPSAKLCHEDRKTTSPQILVGTYPDGRDGAQLFGAHVIAASARPPPPLRRRNPRFALDRLRPRRQAAVETATPLAGDARDPAGLAAPVLRPASRQPLAACRVMVSPLGLTFGLPRHPSSNDPSGHHATKTPWTTNMVLPACLIHPAIRSPRRRRAAAAACAAHARREIRRLFVPQAGSLLRPAASWSAPWV